MDTMTTTDTQALEDAAVGQLREAFISAGLEYALPWALNEYALARAGAKLMIERSGLSQSDRASFLSYVETVKRNGLVSEATERRESAAYIASKMLADWKHQVTARKHSQPQALHNFADS